MDYYDEETRPRLIFQSHSSSSSSSSSTAAAATETLIKTSTLAASLCFAASSFLLFSAFYFLASSQILNFLSVWAALSLFLGPFAPASLTGGDIRVGSGEILDDPADTDTETDQADEQKKRPAGRRSRRSDPAATPTFSTVSSSISKKEPEEQGKEEFEEKEWDRGDYEMLRKQISKHPVGTPKRWEIIAQAFKGRHGVDSVIWAAKSLSEKRPEAGDSFSQFLRQRKPLDKRVEDAISDGGSNGMPGWSSSEDIALLNALKAFPKDTALRWEKIEAAVPGKSKACCMKRVADLKKGFRNSKASEA